MPINDDAYALAWQHLRAKERRTAAEAAKADAEANAERKAEALGDAVQPQVCLRFSMMCEAARTGRVPIGAGILSPHSLESVIRVAAMRSLWRPGMTVPEAMAAMRAEGIAYGRGVAQQDIRLIREVAAQQGRDAAAATAPQAENPHRHIGRDKNVGKTPKVGLYGASA